MRNLRRRFDMFCYRKRNIGIPNLMLFIVLGNALVYLMTTLTGNYILYDILCFNRTAILHGQVWRLISYVFTSFLPMEGIAGLPLMIISYLCYYYLGRSLENAWGTLRFNLFYFCGVILMDIYAMALGGFNANSYTVQALYMTMGKYLNMSLFLVYATTNPDARFRLFMLIPIKGWIFAVIDLGLTLLTIFELSYPINYFPHSLLPLIAIGNFFIFVGSDIVNLLPMRWRVKMSRSKRGKEKQTEAKVVPFPGTEKQQKPAKAAFNHCCAVCGRTDVTNPELEFRYCSRCKGYHCYCLDHIGNHIHVE